MGVSQLVQLPYHKYRTPNSLYIVNTSQPKISIEFVDVQKQFGSSDCGV